MRITRRHIVAIAASACLIGWRSSVGWSQRTAPRADSSSSVATWRPAERDELALSLEFARALLARGLAESAATELSRLESAVSSGTPSFRARYGALAARAAIEASALTTSSERQRAVDRLTAIRALVEGDLSSGYDYFNALSDSDVDGLAYAQTLARSYESLARLVESSEASSSQEVALEITKTLARSLPASSARPFLYRHASTLLATRAPDRWERAEKFADALRKRSERALDEYYFFARVMSIRIARERGDAAQASRLVGETLDALQSASERYDAPREISVALVAEEIRALLLEGKTLDALRQASRETDLRDAPFPEDVGRYALEFYDVFDDWRLARVEAYGAALASDAPRDALEGFDSPEAWREALLAESRAAVEGMTSSVSRAFAGRILHETGATSGKFAALRASGDELFRVGKWRAALAAYDSATSSARASGNADVGYQLDRVAAALVDKICRESLYESQEFEVDERDAAFWRREAARRFDALSRERPTDASAPDFYLLALEYREGSGDDPLAARLEFLTLFPESSRRGEYALALARRALAESDVEVAEQALDAAPSDPAFHEETLALERACRRARIERGETVESATQRALARIWNRFRVGNASQTAPERLATFTPSASGAAILETSLGIALDSNLIQDAQFQEVALRALASQRNVEARADRVAALDALRLSIALAADRGDDALEILNGSRREAGGVSLELVARVLEYGARSDVSADARRRCAEFALDATERGDDEPARRRSLRAEALRLAGRRQEALNLFAAALKENPKDVDAARGVAKLLAAQSDQQTLERALRYWGDVAELAPDGSKEWWDAKEATLNIYRRLGNKEQAEKMTRVLWLTRSDPSDPGRKRRWDKIVREMK